MSDILDKKQKLLIERLVADPELFIRCVGITKPSYFEPPLDRTVGFVKEYFSEFNGIPSVDLIEAETGVLIKDRSGEGDGENDYTAKEIEKFCQQQAAMQAVLKGVDLIEENDISGVQELIRRAAMVKLDDSLGVDLFEEPEERIKKMHEKKDHRKIGIDGVDTLINEIGRGELGIFCAPSGGGKSVMLANVINKLALQNLNVLAISLELDEALYSKRLDTIITGVDISEHRKEAEYIAGELALAKKDRGSIIVKRLPTGTTCSDIRTFLSEYKTKMNFYPDVVVVDYLSGMGIESNGRSGGSDRFQDDKEKSEGLRQIMEEISAYGFTAAQISREGQQLYLGLSASHVQGGISMIYTSDWTIAMVQNEEDRDNNQLKTVAMKLRNASMDNRTGVIYKNPRNLQFTNTPGNSVNTPKKRKIGQKPKEEEKKPEVKDSAPQEEQSPIDKAMAALEKKRGKR